MSQKSDSRRGDRAAAAPKLTVECKTAATQDFSEESKRSGEGKGPDPAQEFVGAEAVGFLKGLGAIVLRYAMAHRYTVLYGLIAFVLAILVLLIGLWGTIVIAVFVFVGALLGQIRDGDNGIVNFFKRMFSNRG